MKETLSTYEITDRLFRDKKNNGFSYAGCHAMAEWLEEYEESAGEELEFDRVAIRCDFSEAETAFEYMHDYMTEDQFIDQFGDAMAEGDEALEESCLEYLQKNTILVEFSGGIIVLAF